MGSGHCKKGLQYSFCKDPTPSTLRPMGGIIRDPTKRGFLDAEVRSLLRKMAIEEVRDIGSPGFYSRLFVVPKKNGKLRPILDLSALNAYIPVDHFKMETAQKHPGIPYQVGRLGQSHSTYKMHTFIYPYARHQGSTSGSGGGIGLISSGFFRSESRLLRRYSPK